jgi:hypothetical protein
MIGGRWLLPAFGIGLLAALLAAVSSVAVQSPDRDWAPEARAAAQQSILDRLPDGRDDVRFADVEVRRSGDDDERWVCGTFAVWNEDGSLGPFRDFWVTVARVRDTWAEIREVRANAFGRDDFLDRHSAHFRACFDHDEGDIG